VLGQTISHYRRFAMNIHDTIRETQKSAVLKAYQQSNGNYTQAVGLLGIHPNHLHRLIRTLNLKAAIIKESV
jgi:transcriptional regulator of acetoin/glycerol metabolism